MDTKGRFASVLGFDGRVVRAVVYRDLDGLAYYCPRHDSFDRVYLAVGSIPGVDYRASQYRAM